MTLTKRRKITPSELEAEIAAVRRAWRVSQPKPDTLPRWFTSAVRDAFRTRRPWYRTPTAHAMHLLYSAGYQPLFDHLGTVTARDKQIAIGEPYETSITIDRARDQAARLAELLGCTSSVSLISWHFPGRTIRVAFSEGLQQQLPSIAKPLTAGVAYRRALEEGKR